MRCRDASAIVDLAAGADAYFAAQQAEFPSHFRKTARLQRNAGRDHGPVRVELGDPDGRLFEALRNWKQAQYRDTGKLDVFGIDWVQAVLADLRAHEGSEFGGLTAALWFGDRLAAARDAAGMDAETLARRLGVRLKTLQDWENDISEPRANRLAVSITPGFRPMTRNWRNTHPACC